MIVQDVYIHKIPQITLLFWLIKIIATTLGETGGDALSMSLDLGYALSSIIFFLFFAVSVSAQIAARRFHRYLYWTVIVATTTTGTTIADFADRTLGIGYTGGSLALFALVVVSLGMWQVMAGPVSARHIRSKKAEVFYWITILTSNTLGTALGDFLADSGAGYEGGALVFAAALVLVAGAYYFTRVSRTVLFWLAFVLTRPLGATLGDMLTKPAEDGGLDMSRFSCSLAMAAVMLVLVWLSPRESGAH